MSIKTKILSALFAAMLPAVFPGKAQDNINMPEDNYHYSIAVGLRAGETPGVTFKQFGYTRASAFELLIGLHPTAASLTGLYERYHAVKMIKGLDWFYGGGAHVAFRTEMYYFSYSNGDSFPREDDVMGLGIDAVTGLEYKIGPIPFALSLELKPFAEFNTRGKVILLLDPGFGLKYTF